MLEEGVGEGKKGRGHPRISGGLCVPTSTRPCLMPPPPRPPQYSQQRGKNRFLVLFARNLTFLFPPRKHRVWVSGQRGAGG